MKTYKNKKDIKCAQESLQDILKRIKPYMPEPPKAQPKKERHWRMARDAIFLPRLPKHNQVTSPF